MSKFGFDKMLVQIPVVKLATVRRMAIITEKYFASTFPAQGIGGKNWQEVKRRIPGTPEYIAGTRDDRTRKILYGRTGQLKEQTEDSINEVTNRRFVLINPLPYASLHNEGGYNGVGALVPARPFMIQNDELTKMQLDILIEETGKIWRVAL